MFISDETVKYNVCSTFKILQLSFFQIEKNKHTAQKHSQVYNTIF